jgi:hypothetical protein
MDRREPVVARKPLAVSGTSIRISPFIWSTRLLADFARIHSRNLRAFLTPHKSSGYRRSAGTLGCGLERPTWLVWRGGLLVQVSASSGAHRDVLLTSGGLGLGGVPRDASPLLRDPLFIGERCRRILPSSRSFNRSPGR